MFLFIKGFKDKSLFITRALQAFGFLYKKLSYYQLPPYFYMMLNKKRLNIAFI